MSIYTTINRYQRTVNKQINEHNVAIGVIQNSWRKYLKPNHPSIFCVIFSFLLPLLFLYFKFYPQALTHHIGVAPKLQLVPSFTTKKKKIYTNLLKLFLNPQKVLL